MANASAISFATGDMEKKNRMSYMEVRLESATMADDVKTVQSILSQGISPNIMFEDGKRPIHIAIIFDSMNVGSLLANDTHIDLDARDIYGTSPLFLAKSISSEFFVSLLLSHGASLEEMDSVPLQQPQGTKKVELKKNTDSENVMVLGKVKHTIPEIHNKVEEDRIIKETSHLLYLSNLGINDLDDARGVRRKKSTSKWNI